MTSRVLQWIGVAAIAALVGGSIAALMLVRERIQVNVASEQEAARRGPDPVELLRADVAALKDDLGALASGSGEQMQALHDALESAAVQRQSTSDSGLAEVRKQIAALQARVDQIANDAAAGRARTDRDLAELRTIANDLAASASLARSNESVAQHAGQPPEVRPEATPPAAEPAARAAPVAEPAPASVPTPEPPKKTFLSFQLPSQSFSFAGRQKLALVPSLSRVGFDAKSTLHDFSGVTQKIEGELVVDLAKPDAGCSGDVRVETASLDTGVADRDADMRKLLGVDTNRELRFEWTAFESTKVDASAMRVSGTAKGKLTLHGVARDVAIPVEVSVDASKRVAIDGELRIAMSDWKIEAPSKLGMIKVEDQVKIWIALRARTLGPVKEAAGGH